MSPRSPRLPWSHACSRGCAPGRPPPSIRLSTLLTPVLRVPVMQENVWNPLKPQLCFFLSPIFHLMGLAGCHFCASANSVLRCERLGRQAGLPPGQSAAGAPGRRRLQVLTQVGLSRGEPQLLTGFRACWMSRQWRGPQPWLLADSGFQTASFPSWS